MKRLIYWVVTALLLSRLEASEIEIAMDQGDENVSDVLAESDESTIHPIGNVIPLEEQYSDVHIGQGEYTYQFVLDSWIEGIRPNTPFALSLKLDGERLDFVKDKKNVYQGVTDEEGKTPIFHTAKEYDTSVWFIRPRFGEGPFGEDFHVTDKDTNEPLAGYAYTILMCEKKPKLYTGFTDSNGFTAYSASKKPVKLYLYEGDVTRDKKLNLKKVCSKK